MEKLTIGIKSNTNSNAKPCKLILARILFWTPNAHFLIFVSSSFATTEGTVQYIECFFVQGPVVYRQLCLSLFSPVNTMGFKICRLLFLDLIWSLTCSTRSSRVLVVSFTWEHLQHPERLHCCSCSSDFVLREEWSASTCQCCLKTLRPY